ncbi:TPA: hypothetical protein N0F65_004597 [Lagenidium giganteum]|uniref:MobA-like NTP transferase domain-containing protein n=1 Tax=Lagenidium giganteum TaxID=4803 RepID=A0AAV2ZAV9_9STRA|nr:TPA: hypothetical protein N0F65_004597 [Lagenidium giganteum]
MVVQRRPTELQAEVPAAVYAVDLTKLSALLQIREDDLVSGFQAKPHVSEMHGVIVDAGEDVPFEAVGHVSEEAGAPAPAGMLRSATDTTPKPLPRLATPAPPASARKKLVRQVLLTAAARPSSLDSDELPKCLIELGSQTIIAHILTQLYAAGIDRVVISVAAGGDKIMAAVKRTPYYAKMAIEFLDLGADNRDGHARSILAARQYFKKGPFLIHTADHIFDKSIISKFTNLPLGDAVACVLVETDISGLVGLPPTAVKVKLGKETVTKISRDLVEYDGIEAGLFLSSVAIFDALTDLATKKEYFSLADALNYFTKFNKLTYVPTGGETWFSIETQEQLAYTQDTDGVAVLSPWTVFLASTRQVLDDPSAKKSMVIGITAADQDASLRVAGNADTSRTFDGFIIGVNSAEPRDATSMSGYEMQIAVEDTTPLLSIGHKSTYLSSSRSHFSRPGSFIEPSVDESFVLSIPMDDETSRTIDELSSSRHAFLIEMNQDPTTPVGSSSAFMLAVPGRAATPAHARKELLPSDITDISLETRGYDENLEVTVVVKRQVPLIGYVLLLSSLITISSVGVALDMEDGVAYPLLKLFWRQTATCLASTPLAIMAIRRNGPPPFHEVKNLVTMLLTGASYAFYLGAFVISLAYTSVGHATLFNNAHSLLIVIINLLTGNPVALYEGLGAAIGVVGGGVTTMDTAAVSGNIIMPSAFGDIIALAGALGGASYFMNAKKLRPKMEMVVFMACLTFTSAWLLLLTMTLMGNEVTWSMDPHHGLFGWLTPRADRLLVEFYLVFICDLIGTMGYISVLKYFDPIVISVVCLLEPIIANVMGIICGVDSLPGYLTVVGAALVTGGTFMVIATQSKSTGEIDATAVVRSANGAMTPTPKALYSARARRKTSMTYGSTH